MTVLADALPDDPSTLKAMLLAERARAERLEQIIKELRRHRLGRRAETLPEDQLKARARRHPTGGARFARVVGSWARAWVRSFDI